MNFSKSCMVPINCSDQQMQDRSSLLECHVGPLPFPYLGLPLGTTRPIIQDFVTLGGLCGKKIKRLLPLFDIWWLSNYVNSVMSALPTFYIGSLKI